MVERIRLMKPVERELRGVAKFRAMNNESRQDELKRLLDTVIERKLFRPLSDRAAGWVFAATNYCNDGHKLPEPDKSRWLSPMMQAVLGFATLKEFMKEDFGKPHPTVCIEPDDF